MVHDEDLLLTVLNSAPVVDETRTEELAGRAGRVISAHFGGTGEEDELDRLRRMRDALHDVIRGRNDAITRLDALLRDAVLVPEATATGIQWELRAPANQRLALRTAQAWSHVSAVTPGRLRACANVACNRFLVDHSRPGTARWCSMATCGNRMKVRAHASRRRAAENEN